MAQGGAQGVAGERTGLSATPRGWRSGRGPGPRQGNGSNQSLHPMPIFHPAGSLSRAAGRDVVTISPPGLAGRRDGRARWGHKAAAGHGAPCWRGRPAPAPAAMTATLAHAGRKPCHRPASCRAVRRPAGPSCPAISATASPRPIGARLDGMQHPAAMDIGLQRGVWRKPRRDEAARDGDLWRNGRDSNPRGAVNPYTLSRRAPSTTRPPFRSAGGVTGPAACLKPQDALAGGWPRMHALPVRRAGRRTPSQRPYGRAKSAGMVGSAISRSKRAQRAAGSGPARSTVARAKSWPSP